MGNPEEKGKGLIVCHLFQNYDKIKWVGRYEMTISWVFRGTRQSRGISRRSNGWALEKPRNVSYRITVGTSIQDYNYKRWSNFR